MASWFYPLCGAALSLLLISPTISTASEVLVRRHDQDSSEQTIAITAGARTVAHSDGKDQQSSIEETDETLDISTGRYSYTFDNLTFTRLGGGICRLGNCSCYPFWKSQKAGTKWDAQEECQLDPACIAFAVDATVHSSTGYHLYYGDDGAGRQLPSGHPEMRSRSGSCQATTIDKADTCLPQYDCYTKNPPVAPEIRALEIGYDANGLIFGDFRLSWFWVNLTAIATCMYCFVGIWKKWESDSEKSSRKASSGASSSSAARASRGIFG